MDDLAPLYQQAAALHHHLCPRIVLGVRMGWLAGERLGLSLPQTGKRLLVIAETDGCFADGIAVAVNAWVGRRTLRIEDYGKVAATFIDSHTNRAIRLYPHPQIRSLASHYVPDAPNRWQAQLLAYQRMPDGVLLCVQEVTLKVAVSELIGRAGQRTQCAACGEEILNGRERLINGRALCLACADVQNRYYEV